MPADLKKELENAGLGQSIFARLIRVDVGTVSRWARGVMPTPEYAWSWLGIWKLLTDSAKQTILAEAKQQESA